MRNAFLSILAGLLLLGAPGAAAAGSCQSANGCASLEHDATANAGKVLIVNDAGTSLVSGGLKSVIVDTSGDSAVDATANAVKFTAVDTAGASLAGGHGARVETIGTATHTAVGTGWQAVVTSGTIPAWAKSVHASCVVTAVTGSPANMYGTLVPMVDGVTETLSGAGGPLGQSGTIVTPIVGAVVLYSVNPDLPLISAGLITVISYGNLPVLPVGKVKLYIRTETAATTWSVSCAIRARG